MTIFFLEEWGKHEFLKFKIKIEYLYCSALGNIFIPIETFVCKDREWTHFIGWNGIHEGAHGTGRKQ